MTGGILLPGDAGSADVLAGKTFSSGPAGFNAVGDLVSPKGAIYQSYVNTVTVSTNSFTGAFNLPVAVGHTALVYVTRQSTTESIALSGLNGSWSFDGSGGAGTYEVYQYRCTDSDGTSGSITIDFAGSIQFTVMMLDIVGTLPLGAIFGGTSSPIAMSGVNVGDVIVIAVSTNTSGGSVNDSIYVPTAGFLCGGPSADAGFAVMSYAYGSIGSTPSFNVYPIVGSSVVSGLVASRFTPS